MAFVAGAVALLLLWSAAINLVASLRRLYVPANLAAAAGLVGVAAAQGITVAQMGFAPAALPAGLAWGAGAAALIGSALAGALATARVRAALRDQRVAGLGRREVARWALFRVPLGTVILEEVAFRGVLLAAWAHEVGMVAAVVGSSVIFGLWHIVPTAQAARANRPGISPAWMVGAVAAGVVLTGLAGAALCWLRITSGSLLAPALAHTAANSLSLAAAFRAHRGTG
ncbi:MAG TPA: CPBP family intramembrane glutamic endopeptidase [Egibacteraceae bacterium]|nr:CPBP family intramembrane glutamic endopeptidase [Egibacteraceae bacterium]